MKREKFRLFDRVKVINEKSLGYGTSGKIINFDGTIVTVLFNDNKIGLYSTNSLEFSNTEDLFDYSKMLYIARDKEGSLTIFDSEPQKKTFTWETNSLNNFSVVTDTTIFKEVKWSDSKPRKLILI